MNPGIASALFAALLFGASTPFAKLFVDATEPLLIAGLLYLSSGVGLSAFALANRNRRGDEAGLTARDTPWLLGAIASGGVAGPALLMSGLARTPGSTASLLLNLESVFTGLAAWLLFREHFHRRIGFGMAAIVAGGVLLSWEGSAGVQGVWGPAMIAGACVAWAIDNNLTRHISGSSPVIIAAAKGLAAGTVNTGLALSAGARLPGTEALAGLAVIGVGGYGVSLVLFVAALRAIGTSRAGAYFATAPFAGVLVSFLLLRELPTALFGAAAALMAAGVCLHVTEHHEHHHEHDEVEHNHRHTHDEHHAHDHPRGCDPVAAHAHPHRHAATSHLHAHFPDIHHRHGHVRTR